MLAWDHPNPNPKRHHDRFSHFYTAHCRVSLYNGPPLPLKIAPFHEGIWTPSKTWFLEPTQVLNPNGISNGSAVFAGLSTVTDRQTDRPRYSVCNNMAASTYVVLQCGLIMQRNLQFLKLWTLLKKTEILFCLILNKQYNGYSLNQSQTYRCYTVQTWYMYLVHCLINFWWQLTTQLIVYLTTYIIMVALCNRETIYIFMLWFVLLLSFFLFFPRLISAVNSPTWPYTRRHHHTRRTEGRVNLCRPTHAVRSLSGRRYTRCPHST